MVFNTKKIDIYVVLAIITKFRDMKGADDAIEFMTRGTYKKKLDLDLSGTGKTKTFWHHYINEYTYALCRDNLINQFPELSPIFRFHSDDFMSWASKTKVS